MNRAHPGRRVLQRAVGFIAVAFGLATMVAGGGVLGGASDPGYVVYRPLLMFNTIMGSAYIAAGVAIWRGLRWSTYAAGTIFALNLAVLGAVVSVYARGGAVATDSLGAMAFRSAVWLALLVGALWIRRPAGA